jgi:hypothetical protein
MKKFYENPIVEITKFDVADIITVSAETPTTPEGGSTVGLDTNQYNAVKAEIETALGSNSGVTVMNGNAYGDWF